jgi:hypothetical protein
MDPEGMDEIIREIARLYPPLIGVEQAAEIAHRRIQTVYDWSSRGLLRNCKLERKGRLVLQRDRFVRFLHGGGRDDGENRP